MHFTGSIIITICLLFCLSSCTSPDNSLPTIDEVLIEAFLLEGQPVRDIKISRVIAVNGSAVDSTLLDINPQLVLSDGTNYNLNSAALAGFYERPDLIVAAGETYTLQLEYNGQLIRAATFVPNPPEALELSEQIIFRTAINDITDIQNQAIPDPIEVRWEAQADALYLVVVRNIETDPRQINTLFEFPAPPNAELDPPSSASSYTINAARTITDFGRHEVIVYRVNPEYALLYDTNSEGVGEIREIRTNIENAFGIFTAVSCAKDTFDVRQN